MIHRVRLVLPLPEDPGEVLRAEVMAAVRARDEVRGARREATAARLLFLSLAPGAPRAMVPVRAPGLSMRAGRVRVPPGEYEDLCRGHVAVASETEVPVDWPVMSVVRFWDDAGAEVALCAWGASPSAPAFADVAGLPGVTAELVRGLSSRGVAFVLDPFPILSRLVSPPMAIAAARRAREHRTLVAVSPDGVPEDSVRRLQRWLVDSQLVPASSTDEEIPWEPVSEDQRVATDADLRSRLYAVPVSGEVPASAFRGRTFVLPGALRAEVLRLSASQYAVRLVDLHPEAERRRSAARLPGILLQACAILEGRVEVIPAREADAVREAYRTRVVRNAWGVPADELRDPFLGPKPVQMGAENALGDEIFAEHYVVTLKADGERQFLICHDGKAYLLDSDLNVSSTGVSVPADMNGVWLDGELIREGRAPIFAAFDAYVTVRGRVMVHEPLIPKRDAEVRHVIRRLRDRVGAQRQIVFEQKLHAGGRTIEEAVRRLDAQIVDGTVRYKTDGYVFTPRSIGPFDTLFDIRLGRRAPRGTRSASLLKWKPPKDLTVDVVVGPREVARDRADNGQEMVGYAARAAGTRDLDDAAAAAALAGSADDVGRYELVEVPDMVVWLAAEAPRAEDGAEIVPGESVVEVSIHPEAGERGGRVFRPRLVRADKTAVLRRHAEEGTDGGAYAANNIEVVLSTVRFAQDPLTREALLSSAARGEGAADGYADAVADRETYFLRSKVAGSDMRSSPLRRAHRTVVDRVLGHVRALISSPPDGPRVLDVACGQGADLARWFGANRLGASTVAAFDLNADNLLNGRSGLVRRFAESNYGEKRLAVSVRSMTEPIDAETETSRAFPALDGAFQELLREVPAYDLVLCNFALHYACGSEREFGRLARTVGERLAEGGLFVATFLDRARVLEEIGDAEEASGRVAGKTVWSIRRTETKRAPRAWGERVTFFLETIGIPTVEYLVDVPSVQAALAAAGLAHFDVARFDELGSVAEIRRARLAADHLDALSRLSGMYMVLVASREPLRKAL